MCFLWIGRDSCHKHPTPCQNTYYLWLFNSLWSSFLELSTSSVTQTNPYTVVRSPHCNAVSFAWKAAALIQSHLILRIGRTLKVSQVPHPFVPLSSGNTLSTKRNVISVICHKSDLKRGSTERHVLDKTLKNKMITHSHVCTGCSYQLIRYFRQQPAYLMRHKRVVYILLLHLRVITVTKHGLDVPDWLFFFFRGWLSK